VVWTWALSFLFGMTVVGSMGAGFQTRFVAPAIPALALLVAAATHSRGPLGTAMGRNVLMVCMCYGSFSFFMYGVMDTAIHADLSKGAAEFMLSIVLMKPDASVMHDLAGMFK